MSDKDLEIDYIEVEDFINEKTKNQNYELQNINKEDLIEFVLGVFGIGLENIEKKIKRIKDIKVEDGIDENYEHPEITKEDLIEFVLRENEKYIELLQKRANNAYYTIYLSIYEYQYYIENKDAKVAKKFSAEEQKIKKKVKKFIEILEPNNQENTEQNKLLSLLEDMQENPYKYAKTPKVIPTAKIKVIDIKNQIVQALSDRLINGKKYGFDNEKPLTIPQKIKNSHKQYFNAVDAIFKKLPF